jgi:hypothetical protein
MAPVRGGEITETGVVGAENTKDIAKGSSNLDVDSGSGSENGEKPVREKLKKTDLEEAEETNDVANGVVSEHAHQGQLKKKRSFENSIDKDEDIETSSPSGPIHTRKRSRDAKAKDNRNRASSVKHSEVVPEDEESGEISGNESDKLVATPQSSGDNSMVDVTDETKPLKKKRSIDDMEDSGDSPREQKIPTTDATRARRSSSEPLSDNAAKIADSPRQEAKRASDKDVDTVMSPEKPTNGNKKRRSEYLGDDENKSHKIPATKESKTRRSTSPPEFPETQDQNTTTDGAKETTSQQPATTSNWTTSSTSATSPFGTLNSSQSPSKKAEDLPQTSAAAFAGSGFAAMTGIASPFGSLASSMTKSPLASPFKEASTRTASTATEAQPQTSSEAFATSGLSSNTGVISPFGIIGKSNGSASPFAASPFASATKSSFGSAFGSGFGGGFGSGSKLSSFAAPVGGAKLTTTTPAKPFGAPETSDEDEGEAESDDEEVKTKAEEAGNSSFGEPQAKPVHDQFKIRKGKPLILIFQLFDTNENRSNNW